MNKIYVFLLVSILAFCVSCGPAADPDNLFEMPEDELAEEYGADESSSQETGTEGGDVSAEVTGEFLYAYGNMQKNVPPGNFAVYQDSILLLYFNGSQFRLYEIDKDTLEVAPFCKDASCNHQNGKCASLGITSNLESYEGEVYALDSSMEIVQLKDGRFERILEGECATFWHADHHLYVCTKDGSLLEYPEDSLKNPAVVSEEYTKCWNVVFDSRLYGANSTGGVTCIELSNPERGTHQVVSCDGPAMTDGRNIYFQDLDNYLYRSNIDGGNIEKLYDTGVMYAALNFDEEYIYFRYYDGSLMGEGSDKIYRALKDDPGRPELIAEFPGYAAAVFTVPGYARIFAYVKENFAKLENDVYAVSKDGSGMVKLEIPEF